MSARRAPRRSGSLQRRSHDWNKWVRQIHRLLSIAFTVTVIANFVAMAGERASAMGDLLTLLPLALLLFTGLYLFVLPYATKWRSGGRPNLRGTVME